MDAKAELAFCTEVITWLGIRRDALEAELAEAEKPELRHWDFGYDEDSGDEFIVIEQSTLSGSPKAFYADQKGQVYVNESTVVRVCLGNLKEHFDDLKAIAEGLTKHTWDYGHNSYEAYIDMHGDLLLNGVSIQLIVRKEEIPTFILNLQRIQYTERQKNDNQD